MATPSTSWHHAWSPWSASRSRRASSALRVRCSIGVALHVDADPTARNALVKAADLAMYRAKRPAGAPGSGIAAATRPCPSRGPAGAATSRSGTGSCSRPPPRPFVIHVEGVIVAASSACLRLIGATDEGEMVGRSLEDFLTPDSAEQSARRQATVRAGGWPTPDVMRIVTFPGTLVDVEVWSHPVVWGAKTANQVHLRPTDSPLAEIARLAVELAGPRPKPSSWSTSTGASWLGTARDGAVRVDRGGSGRAHHFGGHGPPGGRGRGGSDRRGLAEADSWTGVQTSPTKNGPDVDVRLSARFVHDWRDSVLGIVIIAHGVFTGPEEGSELMDDLAAAIDDDQLVVHYQPMVRAEDGVVVKVEALVRWQHPELGLVPPSQFIPRAENTPLMTRITRKVLELATRQVAAWRTELMPPLELAVNVSANELADPRLAADVSAALERSGPPGAGLVARGHRDVNRPTTRRTRGSGSSDSARSVATPPSTTSGPASRPSPSSIACPCRR